MGREEDHRWFKHSVDPDSTEDQELISNCHPPGYQNPAGLGDGRRYNLVAIGGGAAGLVSAGGGGLLGGRTALIERGLLGGDCLNTGCVPSKGLIRAARAIHDGRMAARFGLTLSTPIAADFKVAMERMRRLRARISQADSVNRLQEKYGVDVYLGEARFTGPDTIEVAGRRLRFAKAVIATGGRPIVPPIPGLAESDFHTSETIFNLRQLPPRMVIIGGGPISCELAQAFCRFGSIITILNAGARLLPAEEPFVSPILESRLRAEGVAIHHGIRIEKVDGSTIFYIDDQNRRQQISADSILVAVGRRANVEGLGLSSAGVALTADGIRVNDRLQTSNPRIYAAGDVCSSLKFTHAADAMARIVIRNALFMGRKRLSRLVIPRVTYTDPEVAHVGLTGDEADSAGVRTEVITSRLSDNDRAILDGDEEGLVSVRIGRDSGRIVGGTIIARQAGEMIGQLTLAITSGLRCDALAETIQPYPTLSDSLRRVGDDYLLSRLGVRARSLLRTWLALNR